MVENPNPVTDDTGVTPMSVSSPAGPAPPPGLVNSQQQGNANNGTLELPAAASNPPQSTGGAAITPEQLDGVLARMAALEAENAKLRSEMDAKVEARVNASWESQETAWKHDKEIAAAKITAEANARHEAWTTEVEQRAKEMLQAQQDALVAQGKTEVQTIQQEAAAAAAQKVQIIESEAAARLQQVQDEGAAAVARTNAAKDQEIAALKSAAQAEHGQRMLEKEAAHKREMAAKDEQLRLQKEQVRIAMEDRDLARDERISSLTGAGKSVVIDDSATAAGEKPKKPPTHKISDFKRKIDLSDPEPAPANETEEQQKARNDRNAARPKNKPAAFHKWEKQARDFIDTERDRGFPDRDIAHALRKTVDNDTDDRLLSAGVERAPESLLDYMKNIAGACTKELCTADHSAAEKAARPSGHSVLMFYNQAAAFFKINDDNRAALEDENDRAALEFTEAKKVRVVIEGLNCGEQVKLKVERKLKKAADKAPNKQQTLVLLREVLCSSGMEDFLAAAQKDFDKKRSTPARAIANEEANSATSKKDPAGRDAGNASPENDWDKEKHTALQAFEAHLCNQGYYKSEGKKGYYGKTRKGFYRAGKGWWQKGGGRPGASSQDNGNQRGNGKGPWNRNGGDYQGGKWSSGYHGGWNDKGHNAYGNQGGKGAGKHGYGKKSGPSAGKGGNFSNTNHGAAYAANEQGSDWNGNWGSGGGDWGAGQDWSHDQHSGPAPQNPNQAAHDRAAAARETEHGGQAVDMRGPHNGAVEDWSDISDLSEDDAGQFGYQTHTWGDAQKVATAVEVCQLAAFQTRQETPADALNPDTGCTGAFGGEDRVNAYCDYAKSKGIPVKPAYPFDAKIVVADGFEITVTHARDIPVAWPHRAYVRCLLNSRHPAGLILFGCRPMGALNVSISFKGQKPTVEALGALPQRMFKNGGLWAFRGLGDTFVPEMETAPVYGASEDF